MEGHHRAKKPMLGEKLRRSSSFSMGAHINSSREGEYQAETDEILNETEYDHKP